MNAEQELESLKASNRTNAGLLAAALRGSEEHSSEQGLNEWVSEAYQFITAAKKDSTHPAS